MIVYLITNKINGKKYVGQTRRSIKRRWSGHCHFRKDNASNAINQAIRKYGEDSFTIEELAKASSQEELNELEIKFTAEHNSLSPNGWP